MEKAADFETVAEGQAGNGKNHPGFLLFYAGCD
jgi:hypothetical protein